jgi:hypothetical protein
MPKKSDWIWLSQVEPEDTSEVWVRLINESIPPFKAIYNKFYFQFLNSTTNSLYPGCIIASWKAI